MNLSPQDLLYDMTHTQVVERLMTGGQTVFFLKGRSLYIYGLWLEYPRARLQKARTLVFL